MIEYKIGTDDIDWEGLRDLYGEVGLVGGLGKKRDLPKIREAFLISFKVVTAWDNQRLVGAGRMISDGVCYGMIFDLGILVTHQRQGIGRQIINILLKGHEDLFIHLTSTFGNEEFYKKIGFKKHKTGFAKYPIKSKYLED
ncbi:MAG: N-acetyltransferase [Desulfobulbaceae bacterium]|nr:MAG: N-acetyltransferase [Desulfobulbaceae bacterium]